MPVTGAMKIPVHFLCEVPWQRIGDDDRSPASHRHADLVHRGNIGEDLGIQELSQINVVGGRTLGLEQAAFDEAVDNASEFLEGDIRLPALVRLADRPRFCECHQYLKECQW